MKLEQQVSNLELSRRLKELGVKQESYFCWQPVARVEDGGILKDTGTCRLVRFEDRGSYAYSKTFAAFTVAELGEMLPEKIKEPVGESEFGCGKGFVYYAKHVPHVAVCHGQVADTEANARAKMLIYLIEQGILTSHEGEGRC